LAQFSLFFQNLPRIGKYLALTPMALALAIAPPVVPSGTLQVKVHIDRCLGLETTMSLPVGTTVRELKERLCLDDPTGASQPEDLYLVKVGTSRLLKDGEPLSADLKEVEILEEEPDAAEEEKQEEQQEKPDLPMAVEDKAAEESKDAGISMAVESKAAEESKVPEHPEVKQEPASPQKSAAAGEGMDSPERQVFNLLDRNGKGQISQRDVLVALKKQAPVRKLFGLPASKMEKGGDNLDAQLQDIQDAFEAGSGLGKLAPTFEKLIESGSAKAFDWESFDRVFQTRPHKTRLADAVAMLPREHKTGPVFAPTKEWQEVPEGTVCPGGLEYKMDMSTQKTFARLAPGQSAGAMAAAPAIASTVYKLPPDVEHVFLKRSEDPTKGAIAKVKRSAEYRVHSTGRVWVGPSGGRWAEIDASKSEEKGWALLEGPGFGLKGPALMKHAEDVD